MNSPGIEVKPIITIDGDHEVNSVFFTDVKVPADQLIGEEGKGWTYAKFLLAHERFGIAGVPVVKVQIDKLKKLTADYNDADLNKKIAELEIDLEALEFTELRTLAAIAEGGHPGAESSILKIRGTEIQQRLTELYVEAAGQYILPYEGPEVFDSNRTPSGPEYASPSVAQYLNYRKTSIYGGSNEIQKNIIAKAILGLSMNLNYSDEQNMLREQVLKFCETNYDFIDREKILETEAGYSQDNWKQFADLGWLAVPFKEENGGFNFGPIELTVLFEEFGKALVVEPYLSAVVMSGTILENSNHSNKSSIIEKIIAGEHQISVAYAEPNIGYNFFDCLTSLSTVSDNLSLNGIKSLVLNGGNADQFIVLANQEGSSSVLILVNSDVDGLSAQSFKTIDGQTCAELSFENISIDSESILASGDEAEAIFNKMINMSILCISAEAVGAMNAFLYENCPVH